MHATNRYETILFDLDGTLIDHFQVIYRCYRYASEQLGLDPVDYATVRATVGGSVAITMERLIGKELAPAGVRHFRAHFADIMLEDVTVLAGVEPLLEHLHGSGKRLAVFTNKDGAAARTLCAHLGLDRWLECVIGTNDTPFRKPQPEFTAHALGVLNAKPERTLLIGDSPFDEAAAATHDIACFLVGTGSHTTEQLARECPRARVFADFESMATEAFGMLAPTADLPR